MISNEIRTAYLALGELLGISSVAATSVDPVYDLQSLGFAKLAAAERIREEFKASGDKLKERFAAMIPHWWFVQDMEDYVPMDSTQQALQEMNCGNVRFTNALFSGGADAKLLWRVYSPAVTREWSEERQGFVDSKIHGPDGNVVYAVANDSRSPGGKLLTTNPRVEDMNQVIRNAYAYFKLTNEHATLDLNILLGQGG